MRTMPATPRKRLPTAERRPQLLEVAVRVFGQDGYAGASIADIAREVGISAPALYRHYSSKKALYLAALAHSADRMFDAWERAARDAPNALSAFAQLGMLYQQMMRDEPHLLQIRFRALNATEDPEIRALVLSSHMRAERLASGLAARAAQEGLLPAGLTQAMLVAAFMAWGAMTDVTHHLGLRTDNDVFATALRDVVAHFATRAKDAT